MNELALKQEKRSLLSATSFALSVGVFFLNTGNILKGRFSLQATHFVGMLSDVDFSWASTWFEEVVAEKTSEVVLDLDAVFETLSSTSQSLESSFFHIRGKFQHCLTQ